MSWIQRTIALKSYPRGFHLITRDIVDAVPELAGIRTGILPTFIQHTSASLLIQESITCLIQIGSTTWTSAASSHCPERSFAGEPSRFCYGN